MTTEVFKGTVDDLKARLDVIIATPHTINQVVRVTTTVYLIIYT